MVISKLTDMLLCPLKGAPRVSQKFGENPEMYDQFGLTAHDGQDYGVPVGTPVYAPMDGIVKVKDSKGKGYGLHVRIRNSFKALEVVLAHLNEVKVKDGDKVMMGDLIGLSGNSGYSTGPHLHEGMRRLIEKEGGSIWQWAVRDYSNGYFGYFDHSKFIINWNKHSKFIIHWNK